MNIALIIAGGIGARMRQDIPKQFINVEDKPVIVYVMEAFQKHPEIGEICVVCVDGWEEIVRAYAKQFNITKLTKLVPGGKNGQESIRNGVYAIAEDHKEEDYILVHDAIRPMLSQEIISDCIVTAHKYGNAVVSLPCVEAMLLSEDDIISNQYIDRSKLKRTQTPQAFRVKDLVRAHKEAMNRGITNAVASASMFIELGYPIYFSKGSEKNIKLTTTEDVEIFKSLLHAKRPEWIKV